jgi:hypothetical protein
MIYDSCFKKILKYISMFIVIFLSLFLIPVTKLTHEENIIISMIGTSFYAFVESYFPSVYIDKFNI